ncbi:MAG: hypothetical protein QM775_21920 [Pirellulales bacterium]
MKEDRKTAKDPKDTFDDESLATVLQETGDCLVELKQHKDAVAAYGEALEFRPQSLPSLIGRGKVYTSARRFDLAQADFDRALQHWPASPEARAERAKLLAAQASAVAEPAVDAKSPAAR